VGRLRRFLGFPFHKKRLLAEAALRLAGTSLLLRVLPSACISRRLFGLNQGAPILTSPSLRLALRRDSNEDICWAVRTAARYVPGARCLGQALVGSAMLRRQGYPAEVRVGVANAASGFEAHAWVWSEHRIVLGESSTVFAELSGKSSGNTFPDLSRQPAEP
jgi:hypothetical protein